MKAAGWFGQSRLASLLRKPSRWSCAGPRSPTAFPVGATQVAISAMPPLPSRIACGIARSRLASLLRKPSRWSCAIARSPTAFPVGATQVAISAMPPLPSRIACGIARSRLVSLLRKPSRWSCGKSCDSGTASIGQSAPGLTAIRMPRCSVRLERESPDRMIDLVMCRHRGGAFDRGNDAPADVRKRIKSGIHPCCGRLRGRHASTWAWRRGRPRFRRWRGRGIWP